MTNKYAVELNGLTKSYKHSHAVDHINLTLEPNKIYGLLGRNGAGKTTMLNILTARIFPSGGNAYIFGEDAFENIDILKQICFIEEKGFYASAVKISEVLKLTSGLYPNWDNAYANELLNLFELDKRKKFKQLSRGMESSLGLIIGLASRAPLTIFDEPSLGLDAVVRNRFYEALIEDFAEHPRTVIISTHLIDEVSNLFEDVIMLERGKVLLKSDTMELKEKAFFISGKESAVREAAKDSIILDEEKFGSSTILSVYAENKIGTSEHVEIQPIPLQKLFVKITNPKIYETLKKGGVIQ